jgi:hypothetical protein
LISPETTKENAEYFLGKVWKSLEKFGISLEKFGIPLEFLGKVWRGASATSAADRLACARRLKAYVAAHK